VNRDLLAGAVHRYHELTAATAWRGAAIAIAALFACTLAVYASTAGAMVEIWRRSDTFTHGFVVLPISLWLVWTMRTELAHVAPRPAWWPLPLVAGAGLAWLLGELTAVNAVTQLALVAVLVLGVIAVVGTDVARKLAFPLGFLFFAVPLGEFLMPKLMEWTADFTVLGLRLSGIPVYREGQQFVIPTGNWSVVEACSGVRYLIASLMVGTLYAYLTYRSLGRRLIFVAAAVAVPIVANWVRAYLIVMLGHISGNKLAAGADHLVYGWAFFGVVIALLFFIGSRWREDRAPAPAQVVSSNPVSQRDGAKLWGVALAVLAATAVWKLAFVAIEHADAAVPAHIAPVTASGGWKPSGQADGKWRPHFENPATELNQIFSDGTTRVGLFVAYYRNQHYGSKLVSSDNVLVKGKDPQWVQVKNGVRTVTVGSERVAVRTAELRGSHDERLIAWQWYWVNGRLTASDYRAKAYTALSRLQGRGDDSAAVLVYTRDTGAGGAEKALEAFIGAAGAQIASTLHETRSLR
jgi:exosortase A